MSDSPLILSNSHFALLHRSVSIPALPDFKFQSTTMTATTIFFGTTFLYGLLFHKHVRHIAPSYNPHGHNRKPRTFHQTLLVIHIAFSMSEYLRWHIPSLLLPTGEKPVAQLIDVALCTAQVVTCMMQVKYLRRGEPVMTRSTYQAAGVLRFILTIIAYATSSPSCYKTSIKGLNAFIYARGLAKIGYDVNRFLDSHRTHVDGKFIKRFSTPAVYNMSVFLAAVLAIAEGDLTYAPHVFVLLIAVITVFNAWVSSQVEDPKYRYDPTSRRHQFLELMLWLGYAELRTLDTRLKVTKAALQQQQDIWSPTGTEAAQAKGEITVLMPEQDASLIAKNYRARSRSLISVTIPQQTTCAVDSQDGSLSTPVLVPEQDIWVVGVTES